MDIHDILNRVQGTKGGNGQWSARCPAHNDTHNSLSISTGQDGRILALQALLSAGVELSLTEIELFAEKGGYGVLRLLEEPSKGHIVAPKPERFEADLKELENHFKDISAYRGELSSIGAGGYWGQSSTVGNAIMKGQLDHFEEKVDEIAGRWDCLSN